MNEVDFSKTIEILTEAKNNGFESVSQSGSITPDIVSKLSMLSLYCDTAISNINAASTLYSELIGTD